MTAKQALAEAVKRWGDKAAVQDGGKRRASTPEQRAAAQAELAELTKAQVKESNIFSAEDFPDEMLASEVRRILREERTQRRLIKEARDRTLAIVHTRRYSVGKATWCFEIKGQGDTWELAFAEADERAARDKARYAKPRPGA